MDKKECNTNDSSCISFELDKGGMIAECKNAPLEKHPDSENFSGRSSPYTNECAVASVCNNLRGNSMSTAGVVTVASTNCNNRRPSVYRLPDLEKVSVLGACELDASLAYIVMSPGRTACPTKVIDIYLWVGKSFKIGQSQLYENSNIGDVDLAYWTRVGSDVLSRIGLPEDTNIKVCFL